jgi:hypothetical protein
MSSPTQPRNAPWRCRAQAPRLALELGLRGAGAGDDEADVARALDHRRERVEREVKALLVDQPADQQHEPLVGRGVLRAQPRQVGDHGLEVARVDSVLDHGDPLRRDAEHARDVAAHVPRAGDHVVGARAIARSRAWMWTAGRF